MRKYALLVAVMVGFAACKEKGPAIDLGTNKVVDSSYTASVESAQPKLVLVEELTGAACTNCPDAREDLANMNVTNGHKLIIMGIHPKGPAQGAPASHDGHLVGKYDFRTDAGTAIMSTYQPDYSGLPNAGFDRAKYNGNLGLDRGKWAAAAAARLGVASPVNITITSNYDAASGKATIKIKAAYTKDVTGIQNLSVAIIEDSITDAQEYPGKEIDTAYNFMHVFRDLLTPVTGKQILINTTNIAAGQVFERTYVNYDVNPAWKPKHCHVVAFIHRSEADNKEVLQAAEADLVE